MSTTNATGKWINMEGKTESDKPFLSYGKGYFKCSKCNSILWLAGKDEYCRKCGTRMEVSED